MVASFCRFPAVSALFLRKSLRRARGFFFWALARAISAPSSLHIPVSRLALENRNQLLGQLFIEFLFVFQHGAKETLSGFRRVGDLTICIIIEVAMNVDDWLI